MRIVFMLSVAVPVLLKVKVKGALVCPDLTVPKLCEVGLSTATPAVPVPVNGTFTTGSPGALVVMAKLAERRPIVVGRKTIWIVQYPFLGSV